MFEKLRKYKAVSLAPVVVWLATQLLMTGFFWPISASAGVDQNDSVLSDRIVICTPAGLKSVALNEDGSLPDDLPGEEEECPWCLFFGNNSALAGPSVELQISLSSSVETRCNPGAVTQKEQSARSAFHSRAPPL